MKIESKFYEDGIVVVTLDGELDLHTVDKSRRYIDRILEKKHPKKLVIDLQNIGFIDSSGIGLILGRFKKIQQLNGEIAIICNKSQVKKILEMSGITQIIKIYDSYEDLKQGFGRG